MRVLISTVPAHGHLLPLIPIARAAERAGHDVVIASGVEGVAEARRRGFTTWDVGPSRAEQDAAFRARVPDLAAIPADVRMSTVISEMFGAAARRRAEALVPRAEAWQPDLVIHPVTELAGAAAAARCGARHAVHGLGPLPAMSWTWFGARISELGARWDLPTLAHDILAVPYLDNCPAALQTDAVDAFRIRWPIRPTSGEVLPGERLPWDDAVLRALPHERTVHLTLGTIFHGLTEVFEAALAGLGQLPVNVIVAVGPGRDVDQLGPQPPHVLVTDFAPHALLLPRCDALVTQGGAGTIVAALCHGVPHLILPQGADQFANATTAERAGVALQLLPQAATPDAIADAVARLLEDRSIARTADRVANVIGSMPSADEVLTGLLEIHAAA